MNKIQTWTVERGNRLHSEELTYFQEWEINVLTGIHKKCSSGSPIPHWWLEMDTGECFSGSRTN